MNITVVRVENAIEERHEAIAFNTVKTFTKNLRPGMTKQSKAGVLGTKLVSYQVRYKNGDEVNRKIISSKVIAKPIDRVVQIGSKGRYTSRGEYETRRVVRMSASAYDPGPRSCGKRSTGRTSIGLRAGYGVVAVDPRVIPLGSKLYIEGYGFAVAGDTGGAIKGRRIDLGFGSYREAIRFGRRSVRVHTLKKAVDK
jgi:3D (Asp-Asp-Asp) domain-containing protein